MTFNLEIKKMFRLLVIASLLAAESYCFHVRIANGSEAEDGEFPFAANLRFSSDKSHQCGASILNANFLLSAAQCFGCVGPEPSYNPEDFDIQYGLSTITTDDTNAVKIKKIYCNIYRQEYNNDHGVYENFYDTSVVELAEPLPDDGSWEPVKLSRVFNSTVQQQGVAIGWGIINPSWDESNVLQKLTVDIYNDTVCGVNYTATHHVCSGTSSGYGGTCYGDSGSPILFDGMQVGITSFAARATCGYADQSQPDVYARVEKYFDWIKNIAGDIISN